jgi:hypothetical protein
VNIFWKIHKIPVNQDNSCFVGQFPRKVTAKFEKTETLTEEILAQLLLLAL